MVLDSRTIRGLRCIDKPSTIQTNRFVTSNLPVNLPSEASCDQIVLKGLMLIK